MALSPIGTNLSALYHLEDERGRKALTWWYTDGGEVTRVGQKEVTPWDRIF